MEIQENISLKPYNTFGIDVKSKWFATINNVEDFKKIFDKIKTEQLPFIIIGGGSNILFTKDFEGISILNQFKGQQFIKEDQNHVYIKYASGEIWHDIVLDSLSKEYFGLENLSLIPGTVGAAPIQNIGAYGVEVKDVIVEVEAYDIQNDKTVLLKNEDCNFGYRDSVFKNKYKNKYFIISVTFKLNKVANINSSYGAIEEVLKSKNISKPTPKDISNAVISIRSSKLPDPKQIGNAGSFFKNPEIPKKQYKELKNTFPTIPSYPINENTVKIPAGWLIEQCGWKGKKINNYGVHTLQALVLVNYGESKGEDIAQLAEDIKNSVFNKFNITIEKEVNII